MLDLTCWRKEAGPAGGVVRVRLLRDTEPLTPARRPVLPGSGRFRRALVACSDLADEGQWALLEGEPGTGKPAKALGMSRARIYRKTRDHGIDIPN